MQKLFNRVYLRLFLLFDEFEDTSLFELAAETFTASDFRLDDFGAASWAAAAAVAAFDVVPFSFGWLDLLVLEAVAALPGVDLPWLLAFMSELPNTDLDLLAALLARWFFRSAFSFSSNSAFSRSINKINVLQRRWSSIDVRDLMNQSNRNCGACRTA